MNSTTLNYLRQCQGDKKIVGLQLLDNVGYDHNAVLAFFKQLSTDNWKVSVEDLPIAINLTMNREGELFYVGKRYTFFFEAISTDGCDAAAIILTQMRDKKTNRRINPELAINADSAEDWLRIIAGCSAAVLNTKVDIQIE